VGTPWPGAQFRQVSSGVLEPDGVWLDGFRIVRRPEAIQVEIHADLVRPA